MMSTINYDALFSGAAASLRQSPIRELHKFTKRVGMISFAGGYPDKLALPVAEFAGTSIALGRSGMEIMQSSPTEGYGPLLDILSARLSGPLGREIGRDEMIVTNGITQALDLLAASILDAGDAVIVEEPTYPGTLHTLACRGASVYAAALDDCGMTVESAEAAFAKAKADGRRAKLICVTPNFQNPTGSLMPSDRRRDLAALAARHGALIYESDPYGALSFDDDAPRSIFAEDAELGGGCVVYAGSFSYAIGPGIRLGWLVGPAPVVARALVMKQGADMGTSPVIQALAAQFCAEGRPEQTMPRMMTDLRRHRDAMAAALTAKLPSAKFETPKGGIYIWAKLAGKDTNKLFLKAIERGVIFMRGGAFSTTGGCGDMMRLSYASSGLKEIETGVDRIAEALKQL